MTLIIGMSKPEGIYLSVDYRVTDARTGRVIDDASVKHLLIHYLPLDRGVRALVAYTGLAVLPDGTSTGLWIRETLRGESQTPDQSLAHLRMRLDRDIAPTGFGLIVNVLAIQGDRRFFGGFSNLRHRVEGRPHTVYVAESFGYSMQELHEPFWFANGSGALKGLRSGHVDRLENQSNVKPRRPFEHMKLLAVINRQVAAREASVSPHCHVSFVGEANDGLSPLSHVFTEGNESVPFEMPVLLYGIDGTPMARHLHDIFSARLDGRREPAALDDLDAINEQLKRRP